FVPGERESGLVASVSAIRGGELVVLPTDTVYGVGADAFNPAAVARLMAAKQRGREMPPPVLVAQVAAMNALVADVEPWVGSLVQEYWPGPLTLVCHQQRSLQWDLGDT